MASLPHFVVIGTGGLGCPALLGLVAAGARRLTIVDDDRVELSNLPRQVLFGPADVGFDKAATARLALLRRVPAIGIDLVRRRIAPEDADAFVRGLPADACVLECTDAPAVKFAVQDACLRHGRPCVVGAALGTAAQVMGVGARGPCYRCVFEAPPPDGLLPTCDRAGVFPTAVGFAGFAMAHVAITGSTGALLVFDAADGSFRTLRPAPRPGCEGCRGRPHAQPTISAP